MNEHDSNLPWADVRVFISSTFRDMHAERDYLVKVCFPRLRQWCEERRLHFVDVDLRWGITREESENGHAVELCLQELERDNPFFICLLGEQYGWVPSAIPGAPVWLNQWVAKKLSITHMEILHAQRHNRSGAKVDGTRPAQSFFYFRDPQALPHPAALAGYSPIETGHYASTYFTPEAQHGEPDLRLALAELKRQIVQEFEPQDRVFVYPAVWDTNLDNPSALCRKGLLTGLEALACRMEADIKRGIVQAWPEYCQRALAPDNPLQQEQSRHDTFIASRVQLHVPDPALQSRIDAYLAAHATTQPLPLLLHGPAGCGKSAALCHWISCQVSAARAWRGEPDSIVIFRAIGASPATARLPELLANIWQELVHRLKEKLSFIATSPGSGSGSEAGASAMPDPGAMQAKLQKFESVPGDPAQIMHQWPVMLAGAGELSGELSGESSGKLSRPGIILIIDGLDQLESDYPVGMLSWLPAGLPVNVRLIMSAADLQTLHPDVQTRQQTKPQKAHQPAIDWVRGVLARGAHEILVPLLDEQRCRAIIRELPSIFAKSLDQRQTVTLLDNPASRNPLFLSVALRELKLLGSPEVMEAAIKQLPRPMDETTVEDAIHALFGMILNRLEMDQPPELREMTGSIFAWLCCARRGLSEDELEGLLARCYPDNDSKVRAGVLQVSIRQVREYLCRKQTGSGMLIGFFHRSFEQATALKYLYGDVHDSANPNHTADRLRRYRELAGYFSSLPYFGRAGTTRQANAHKVIELPWLLRRILEISDKSDLPDLPDLPDHSGHPDLHDTGTDQLALANLVSDWEFLEAKHEAGLIFELADDLRQSQPLLRSGSQSVADIGLIEEALRRDIGFIHQHRADYPQALFQCLWNSCWWFDHPKAQGHYAASKGSHPFDGRLAHWAQNYLAQKARHDGSLPWLRQLRPPFLRLGEGPYMAFRDYAFPVTCLAFSPNGRFLLAGSQNPAISLRDIATGQEVYRIASVGHSVLSMAISPDNKRFAIGLQGTSDKSTIREYALLSGEHLASYVHHRSSVTRLAYASDMQHLVAASADASISVWAVASGQMVCRIGEQVPGSQASFALIDMDLVPDSTQLVVSVRDSKRIALWDWAQSSKEATGVKLKEWKIPMPSLRPLAVSADGRWLVGEGQYTGFLGVWIYALHTGKLQRRIDFGKSWAKALCLSHDSELIAAVDADNRLRVWRIADGHCIADSVISRSTTNAICFAPDGLTLALATGNSLARKKYSTEDDFAVYLVRPAAMAGVFRLVDHENDVKVLTYVPNGEVLVSASERRISAYKNEPEPIKRWDAASMHLQACPRNVAESIDRFYTGKNSKFALTTGRCHTATEPDASFVRVWQWPQLKPVFQIRAQGWARVILSPDGASFWLASNNKIQQFASDEYVLKTGKKRRTVKPELTPVVFSADGTLALSVLSQPKPKLNRLTIVAGDSLAYLNQITISDGRIGVACFSPDNTLLICAIGFAIRVMRWQDACVHHELLGHAYDIETLTVSDDGVYLTSTCKYQIRIWDLRSGQCLAIRNGAGDVSRLAADPAARVLWPCNRKGEMAIMASLSADPLAWLPGSWHYLTTHPTQDQWAGTSQWHVNAWRLALLSTVRDEFENEINPEIKSANKSKNSPNLANLTKIGLIRLNSAMDSGLSWFKKCLNFIKRS